MLDAQPLLDVIDARGGTRAVLGLPPVAAMYDRERPPVRQSKDPDVRRWLDTLRRVRRQGRLSPWCADRICVRLLGTLPQLVWGQEWWDAIPDDEGDVA